MNKNIESISSNKLRATPLQWEKISNKALNASTTFWFIMAVLGQWIFAYYILVFYGGSSLSGNFKKWEEQLEHGFLNGDFLGNLMISAHIGLAFVITMGGPLQLIPKLRNRYKSFHRWNGRIYVITAFVISLAGLYIITFRGIVGGTLMGVGNIINASLIMLCAVLTWRYVIAGNLQAHQRWAVRLFLVVSGVWFIRVGFGLWIAISGGPSGEGSYFEEPFFVFLIFAHTLLPITIHEIYLWVKNHGGAFSRMAMAVSLFGLTLLMVVGLVMVTIAFWLPFI